MLPASRRRFLRFGGASVAAGAAGCLDDIRAIADAPESKTTGSSETVGGDADSETIDGRLHNQDEVARVFHIALIDGNEDVRDGSFEVEAGETIRIPAVGSPGDVLAVEATVGDTDGSETLELGGEAEPGALAGFVDIAYRTDGEIEIAFEPTD